MTDVISSEELLDRYARLCEAADRHGDEGWRSAHEDGIKRALTITADQLDRFASMAIGGIGFEPVVDYQGFMPVLSGPVEPIPRFTPEQAKAYAEAIRNNLERLKLMLEQEPSIRPAAWLKTARFDGVVGGASVTATLFGETLALSMHTLRVSLRAFRMRNMLGHIPRAVLEIGGGHGRFVRDVLMLAPGVRAVYCDLTFNLLLAARYLTRMFGADVHLAWDDDEPIPVDAKIVLLPPWRLRDIPFPVEACCNFLSFHHMENRNVRYYSDRLSELDVAAIFHYNRLQPLHERESTLADGAFGPEWRSVVRVVRSSSRVHMTSGATREVQTFEELLVRDGHVERYVESYRERKAYEKLLKDKLDREAAASA
ncbi:MAG: putative sugar O-methyltransferase [Thalassobaculaceae bacterium]|nr:putative sugar O-methyltransferase [Thalassobaculaceae bacterium]